jgi:hypothetical protein
MQHVKDLRFYVIIPALQNYVSSTAISTCGLYEQKNMIQKSKNSATVENLLKDETF